MPEWGAIPNPFPDREPGIHRERRRDSILQTRGRFPMRLTGLDKGIGFKDSSLMAYSHRKLTAGFLMPLLIGLIGLFNLMQRPRFASFHTVDVLQLIASGMCFGVALAGVFALLRSGQGSS
ncbi:MAG: hypothetical protein LAO21_18000 [Acidobacteriia bacterium]|nr:hypothetical protein [Terriglobia bacterium]